MEIFTIEINDDYEKNGLLSFSNDVLDKIESILIKNLLFSKVLSFIILKRHIFKVVFIHENKTSGKNR